MERKPYLMMYHKIRLHSLQYVSYIMQMAVFWMCFWYTIDRQYFICWSVHVSIQREGRIQTFQWKQCHHLRFEREHFSVDTLTRFLSFWRQHLKITRQERYLKVHVYEHCMLYVSIIISFLQLLTVVREIWRQKYIQVGRKNNLAEWSGVV